MQINEDYEKRIQNLEKRVQVLESIINGTSRKKPGRTPILSADEKAEVIRKNIAGCSYSCLAKEYGVSKTTIFNICRSNKGKTNSQYLYKGAKTSACPIQKSTAYYRSGVKQEDRSLSKTGNPCVIPGTGIAYRITMSTYS